MKSNKSYIVSINTLFTHTYKYWLFINLSQQINNFSLNISNDKYIQFLLKILAFNCKDKI